MAEPGALVEDSDAGTLSDSLTNRYLPSGMTRWAPDSGETIAQRLGMIVGAAMGYEAEDLPWEVPLIELGLDSLMAVRIKNRVEYDFDLPPIQLTAVRDANLYNVEELIKYAIEHRDEVQQLHEHQRTQTAEEIARAQAELVSGASPAFIAALAPDPQAEPQTQAPPASEVPVPPPPTDPSGPNGPEANGAGQPNLAGAAEALNQQAVAKALNSDVPPRDAAERVTFATWAIVTGKSPGGIFNTLPKLDGDAAAKMAQRLSERAEGPITAEDVLTSSNIEALADKVRGYLEAGSYRRVRPHAAGAAGGQLEDTGVRVPPGRRLDGGLRAAAQSAAGGHPDVRLRAGRGHDRRACGAIRSEADRDAGRRAVHSGRLVARRGAGLRVRDRAQADWARTSSGSG